MESVRRELHAAWRMANLPVRRTTSGPPRGCGDNATHATHATKPLNHSQCRIYTFRRTHCMRDIAGGINCRADAILNKLRSEVQYRDRMLEESRRGGVLADEETAKGGCCFPLWRKKPDRALSQAIDHLQFRVSDLECRAATQRQMALAYKSTGKKTEALAALRRANILGKQIETATTALVTLESQILMLEDAKLQSEISSALSSSVVKVKKTSKGLLSRTEKAVDDAAEARDLSDDVKGVMDGLATNTGVDEDDLLAELEAMTVQEPPTPAAVVPTFTFSLPSVPTSMMRTHRRTRLADDDSSAVQLRQAM